MQILDTLIKILYIWNIILKIITLISNCKFSNYILLSAIIALLNHTKLVFALYIITMEIN